MDLYKVNDTYFSKLFESEWPGTDIKGSVLLVDKYTMGIISVCYSQSQLLQQDVILIDLIENHNQLDQMKHLNCIIYIKPVNESIDYFSKELQAPHFNNYKVFFNNIINKNQLERIAECDKFEVITNVVELFQDYLVINHNLFQISSTSIIDETNRLLSLLLSIKKFPIIKFENNSIHAKKLSSELLYQINSNLNNNLFENLNFETPPVFLLIDRYNDPITPLLNPWTFQSMIHELIGINKNIIEVSNEKTPLCDKQDEFWNSSLYSNYGDLTESFQKRVEIFKKESNSSIKTSNLVELKRILTKLPDFKKKLANILKHLNILTELDHQISKQNLWEISELQQTIICELDSKQAIEETLVKVLSAPNTSLDHKIKLLLLYSIKFKQSPNKFINYLENEASLVQLKLLSNFFTLFKNVDLQTKAQPENNFKKFFNNFGNSNEVDNVFLQYTPPLKKTLEQVINGVSQAGYFNTLVPDTLEESNVIQDVIVYFKNGVTYEEARIVHELNQSNKKVNLIIGSDSILNSTTWLQQLYDYIN